MPKRIVVLDGHTTTPRRPGADEPADEPGWDAIAALGELTVHPRTAPRQVVQRVGEAELLITNKTQLPAATLAQLPRVRYIGLLSTGTNVVDLDEATRRGIVVTNVPAYSTASVAQLVFALLLEITHRVAEHDAAVRRGDWTAGPDFCFTVAPLMELAGKTLGVVGAGDIGQSVLKIGHALGMNLLVYSRSEKPLDTPARWVELDELLAGSDVVSLNCPLTAGTRHLINAEALTRMKPSAILINTGRGPLIDEPALADALRAGHIAAAGLDVLSAEPPPADHPLIGLPNCLITPHIAWATREARTRLLDIVAENLQAFLDGRPRNVVNP